MATDNEHLFPPLNEPIPYSSHMAASENEADEPSFSPVATPLAYLQKFRLYETRSISNRKYNELKKGKHYEGGIHQQQKVVVGFRFPSDLERWWWKFKKKGRKALENGILIHRQFLEIEEKHGEQMMKQLKNKFRNEMKSYTLIQEVSDSLKDDPSTIYVIGERELQLWKQQVITQLQGSGNYTKYYMVGRDKSRRHWRVLKIDRLEASELNIREDFTTYTENECSDLLRTIHEGNRSTGGLKFVTTCYGIVGFIKFLGPYYMLLITKRRPIGSIGGHTVYAISKTEMISLSDTVTQSNLTMLRHENRYKKLLCMVDLTKDFFFSYSYHVMCSLQKNSCNDETRQVLYETMFVWNEFLTRGIRNFLQNTMWTVALDKLSISGRDFRLTLISRRSRHYAGTRYLKRGVNEKGRVANDVETEQILFEDVPDGFPMQISSVVQNRGSIPLFWSQETSRLNIKPDIMRDQNYEATRLHFQNLVKRYGNPIIILNLIKTNEKRPRESILRTEFANAIKCINKDLSEENHLKFLHWDLHKHSRSKGTNALLFLGRLTAYALTLTGFFYCQVVPVYRSEGCLRWPCFENVAASNLSASRDFNIDDAKSCDSGYKNTSARQENYCGGKYVEKDNSSVRLPMFQKGILRTNCIDCLDRTNVAQYAYGLAALGRQLHALGAIGSSEIDLDNPLAEELMGFYERMGDTLAHQYGGSAAHNK
ncbi:Synaptojanin, N-terminal, partial [Cynara cardunculus var. scolymus]